MVGCYIEFELERMSDIYWCYYYNFVFFFLVLAGIYYYVSYFRFDGGCVRLFDVWYVDIN